MARPPKLEAAWFPHYVKGDQTIAIFDNEFGNLGYAFWFRLLELLCDSPGQAYEFRAPIAWRALLARTRTREPDARQMLDVLSEIGAIDAALYQQQVLWCQPLVDSLDELYRRRAAGKPQRPTARVIDGRNSPDAANPPAETTAAPITADNNTSPPHPPIRAEKRRVPSPNGDGPHPKRADANVLAIFQKVRDHFGFPGKVPQDPIPSYAREGQAIKRMFARGFTSEQILTCWQRKVAARGTFVSMTWVNQDIADSVRGGEPDTRITNKAERGGGTPAKKQTARRPGQTPTEAELDQMERNLGVHPDHVCNLGPVERRQHGDKAPGARSV